MPAVAIFLLAQGIYTPGTYQGLIDTPGNIGAQLTINNSVWLPGTQVTTMIEFSYDGGLTYPDMVTSNLDETAVDSILALGSVRISMSWKVTADQGIVKPDHARLSIVLNQTTTTSASGGWF